MPNPNTLYANTFIDALVAAGVARFCLAPGSRHTPLVLALARHRDTIDISIAPRRTQRRFLRAGAGSRQR